MSSSSSWRTCSSTTTSSASSSGRSPAGSAPSPCRHSGRVSRFGARGGPGPWRAREGAGRDGPGRTRDEAAWSLTSKAHARVGLPSPPSRFLDPPRSASRRRARLDRLPPGSSTDRTAMLRRRRGGATGTTLQWLARCRSGFAVVDDPSPTHGPRVRGGQSSMDWSIVRSRRHLESCSLSVETARGRASRSETSVCTCI